MNKIIVVDTSDPDKAIFGFYSLEGKILYAEHEIENYLRQNYHPPFK